MERRSQPHKRARRLLLCEHLQFVAALNVLVIFLFCTGDPSDMVPLSSEQFISEEWNLAWWALFLLPIFGIPEFLQNVQGLGQSPNSWMRCPPKQSKGPPSEWGGTSTLVGELSRDNSTQSTWPPNNLTSTLVREPMTSSCCLQHYGFYHCYLLLPWQLESILLKHNVRLTHIHFKHDLFY
jgi:hypothetical protein